MQSCKILQIMEPRRGLVVHRRVPLPNIMVPDVQERILFLLCLQKANHLPKLPNELVHMIVFLISKPGFQCIQCDKKCFWKEKTPFTFYSMSCDECLNKMFPGRQAKK